MFLDHLDLGGGEHAAGWLSYSLSPHGGPAYLM